MTVQLTTNQVWEAIEKKSFAVVSMVTASYEARARTSVNGTVESTKTALGQSNGHGRHNNRGDE